MRTFLFLCLLITASCKKEDPPQPKTNFEIITSKKWVNPFKYINREWIQFNPDYTISYQSGGIDTWALNDRTIKIEKFEYYLISCDESEFIIQYLPTSKKYKYVAY